MKRTYLWLPAALLLLSACSASHDETVKTSADDSPVPITLTATAKTAVAGTRAVIDTDESVFQNSGYFLEGEQVDIFFEDYVEYQFYNEGGEDNDFTSYTQPLVYTSDGAGNLTNTVPQYWPKKRHSLNVWGCYPSGIVYNPILNNDPSLNYDFTVETDQTTIANYRASDLMLGTPSSGPLNDANPLTQSFTMPHGTVGLTFTHMLSKIVINLGRSDATDADDPVVTNLPKARVTILNTKPTTRFNVCAHSITGTTVAATPIIARQTSDDTYNGLSVAAIIIPQPVNPGQFIKVEVSNGTSVETFIFSLGSSTTFQSGKVYTYNINVHKPGILLTADITDWDDNAGANNATGAGVLQP